MTIEPNPTSSILSLYIIEGGLAELLLNREEALEDLARLQNNSHVQLPPVLAENVALDLAEAQQALAIIDKTIAEYMSLEIRKVDNYHKFFTVAESLAKDLKAEEQRLATRRKRIEASIAHLKGRALAVMDMAEKKRVEGTGGRYLLRKGNGGLKPLVIDGWDAEKEQWTTLEGVLPESLIDVTVKLRADQWEAVLAYLDTHNFERPTLQGRTVSAPSISRIRAALVEDCEVCHGTGTMITPAYKAPCPHCNSGKRIVPGARLAERGEHLEVK